MSFALNQFSGHVDDELESHTFLPESLERMGDREQQVVRDVEKFVRDVAQSIGGELQIQASGHAGAEPGPGDQLSISVSALKHEPQLDPSVAPMSEGGVPGATVAENPDLTTQLAEEVRVPDDPSVPVGSEHPATEAPQSEGSQPGAIPVERQEGVAPAEPADPAAPAEPASPYSPEVETPGEGGSPTPSTGEQSPASDAPSGEAADPASPAAGETAPPSSPAPAGDPNVPGQQTGSQILEPPHEPAEGGVVPPQQQGGEQE